MKFPRFGKNAIKECRCYCCDSDPLSITHLESPEGEEVERCLFLLSSSDPLISTHTHAYRHTHTSTHLCVSFLIVPSMRSKRPFMLCWQCRWRRCECLFFFLFYILYKSWCLFVYLFLLLSLFLSVSERSINWAINICYSRRPTFPSALQ